MRILTVHNYYKIRGGEDECFEAEIKLLREMGEDVEIYQENNDRVAEIGKLRMAADTIWSKETYEKFKQRLIKKPLDIVHIHNFFPLISPSIYYHFFLYLI